MTYTADPATIRSWARAEGIAVGTRGRLSAIVKDLFYKAHTPTGKPKKARS